MENYILALFDTGTIKIIVAIFMGLSLYCVAFFAIAYKMKRINQQLLGYVLYLISFSGVIIFLLTDSRNREIFNHSKFSSVSYEFRFSWLIIILPLLLNAINYLFNRITNQQVNHGENHYANQAVNQVVDYGADQAVNHDVNKDLIQMANNDVKQNVNHYKNQSVEQNIIKHKKMVAPFPIKFAYSVFLAPTIEEILFRGILFWHIYLKFGLIPAMVLNSMIFAFLHLKLRVLIFSFIGGIIFSYLAYECNSLYAAILAHCLYNFLSFLPGIWKKIHFILSKNTLGGNT
jgi:membrane protease YdiL (CAAX protease family)